MEEEKNPTERVELFCPVNLSLPFKEARRGVKEVYGDNGVELR